MGFIHLVEEGLFAWGREGEQGVQGLWYRVRTLLQGMLKWGRRNQSGERNNEGDGRTYIFLISFGKQGNGDNL